MRTEGQPLSVRTVLQETEAIGLNQLVNVALAKATAKE
jgi:hypothetical protein